MTTTPNVNTSATQRAAHFADDFVDKRSVAKPRQAMPACQFSADAARLVLRGLACNGVTVVRKARSAHGSDCPCDDHDGHDGHKDGSMRHCRCVRVMRLRTARNGDWLLVFGDYQEGPSFKLSGPYAIDAKLTYGGGFWESVKV